MTGLVPKIKSWILDLSFFSLSFLAAWYDLTDSMVSDEDLLGQARTRFAFSLMGAILLTGLLRSVKMKTLGSLWGDAKTFSSQKKWSKNLAPVQAIAFFFLILVAGLKVVHFSFYELLDRDGFDGAQRLFSGMARPKLELFPKAIVQMVQTMFMAFISTLFALPAAFALSFFAAKNVMSQPFARFIRQILKFVLNLVSSVEALIWAIIFSVWVGIGPFAGVLALTVHSIVSLARGFSELIEVSSAGPVEGVRSTGANHVQVVWFGFLPQVILPFLSHAIYRWDMNIRMATIVGLVGGGGIGTLLMQNLGLGLWHELGTIILVIAMAVWFLDFLSSALREILK